jgi:hypothetical protein
MIRVRMMHDGRKDHREDEEERMDDGRLDSLKRSRHSLLIHYSASTVLVRLAF